MQQMPVLSVERAHTQTHAHLSHWGDTWTTQTHTFTVKDARSHRYNSFFFKALKPLSEAATASALKIATCHFIYLPLWHQPLWTKDTGQKKEKAKGLTEVCACDWNGNVIHLYEARTTAGAGLLDDPDGAIGGGGVGLSLSKGFYNTLGLK